MTENECELLEGLRALAASEPREASVHVERNLLAQFRARAGRRRRLIRGSAAALFATAAMIAMFFWAVRPKTPTNVPALAQTIAAPIGQASIEPAPPAANAPIVRYAVMRTDDLVANFYPLPEAEYLPPLETTIVVRVQMPVSSLRLMGVPMEEAVEDWGSDPVQADVLLGQDGLARGVRLIQ